MRFLKHIIFLFIALISTSLMSQNEKPIVVLELFTSQGCSSCPSADIALNEAKNSYSNVIVMSYHVDYWNYIGWKDPFSKTAYADKQRSYARKFKSETIYTPQTVVNGKTHFVGSKKELLKQNIETFSKQKNTNAVQLKQVKRFKDAISLDYIISGSLEHKKLRIALVIDERKTEVKRGENRNRTLSNTNIVVNEVEKPLYKNLSNGKATIKIPESITSKDQLSLIVLVENEDNDILGGIEKKL
jgi:hypothetical protein